MKTWAIITYTIGALILLISCFTNGVAITWFLGIFSLVILSGGCFLQVKSQEAKNERRYACARVMCRKDTRI